MCPRPAGPLAAALFLLIATITAPFLPAQADEKIPGLVLLLKGHKENVFGVAFSPDGKMIVTTSGDPSVKVWDAASGKEIKAFGSGPTTHTQIVLAAAVHPDGASFATASADNTVKFWDMPTTRHQMALGQPADATAAAVSPDGSRVAAGGADGKVRFYNTADGKLLGELPGAAGAVRSLAFSGNGQTLSALSADGVVRIWNTADSKLLSRYAAHPGEGVGAGFHPTQALAYTAGADGTLKFWTMPPAAPKALPNAGMAVKSFATDGTNLALVAGKSVVLASLTDASAKGTFASDVDLTGAALGGGFVAAGTPGRDVLLWKAKEPAAKPMRLPAHEGGVSGVAISPAGTQLATCGKDGVVRLWALPINPTRQLATAAGLTCAVLLPDGKRVAAAGTDKAVRLFKIEGGQERQLLGHPGTVRAIAIAADGKTPISAGDDGTIRVWSAKADTAAVIGAHEGPVTTLIPVGERVISASGDGSVKLWQPAAGTGKETLAHAGAVLAVAVSPDGARLATACDDRQVRLWTMATGKLERTYAGPTMSVACVAWSRDGGRLAAGAADGSVFVWESASMKEVRKLTGLPGAVRAVGLPADGKGVIAGFADGSARQLEIATGKEMKAYAGPKSGVTALLLPTKGDVALIGHEDGTVASHPLAGGAAKTWKAAGPVTAMAVRPDASAVAVGGGKVVQIFALDGKELGKFTTPAGVKGLAYSTDGKRLAVAGDDGKALAYDGENRLMEILPHDGPVHCVAFASEGRVLVSGGADKTARVRPVSLVWQARAGGPVAQAVNTTRGIYAACGDGTVLTIAPGDGKAGPPLKAHTGAISGLSATADGSKFATVGADGFARVWEAGKAAALKEIKLPAAAAGVALSPNATRLAVSVPAGKGHHVHVFDAVSGYSLVKFGESEVMTAAVLGWQADNRTLMTAGEDGKVQLIDVAVQSAIEAHKGGVSALAYAPAGTTLLTAGADKAVTLWNLTTLKAERTFGPLAEAAAGIAWSRDGQLVAATAGKKALLWTAADAKPAGEYEAAAALSGLAFNGDKTRLLTAGADGRARVWDLAAKREAMAFLHDGPVSAVAWHPTTPTQAYTAGDDKQALAQTVPLARIVPVGAAARSLAVSATGAFVCVAGADGKVRRFNGTAGGLEKEYPCGDKAVIAAAISKSEAFVAAAGSDNRLRLFTSGEGKEIAALPLLAAPRAIAYSPDNRAVLAALSNGMIAAVDVQYTPGMEKPEGFGKVAQSFTHGTDAVSVAFTKEGGAFWSAGADKTVKGWKLAADAPTKSLPHPNSVNALAFDREGKVLLTGCGDGKLRTFDVAKGALLKQIDAHAAVMMVPQGIYGVAISPDGKTGVSGSADGSAKVFDLVGAKLLKEFKAFKEKEAPDGHSDSVLAVCLSPDGKMVASGGMDQTIKVWNVADGKLVRQMANPAFKGVSHPGWVYALKWTSDGKHIVAAGAAPKLRGYLSVWEAGTGKLVSGQEINAGTIFALNLSPDEKTAAIGTGGSIRPESDVHQGIILKLPGR